MMAYTPITIDAELGHRVLERPLMSAVDALVIETQVLCEAVFIRENHSVNAVAQTQLHEHPTDVGLHG